MWGNQGATGGDLSIGSLPVVLVDQELSVSTECPGERDVRGTVIEACWTRLNLSLQFLGTYKAPDFETMRHHLSPLNYILRSPSRRINFD